MTFTRTAILLVAGAALLAACSRPAGNTQTASGAASGAAAAGGPDTNITANDLPHPKAGMWEVATSVNGRPAETERNCESGQPINLGKDLEKIRQFCAISFKRTFLGDYVVDSTCNMQGIAGSTHMVVHGDFLGGGYTTDSTSSFTFPGRPATVTHLHSEAHWVGPC